MDPNIARFLEYLQIEAGLSKNTVRSYRQDLSRFFKNMHQLGLRDIKDLSTEMLCCYLAQMLEAGYSPRSVARSLSTLRMFLKYLVIEGIIDKDIVGNLSSPKTARRLPSVLSIPEIQRLLKASENTSNPNPQRDQAILELFYACGARVSEIAQLRLSDINMQIGYVRLMGKGSKERVVPINRYAVEKIRAYLTGERARMVRKRPSEYLFVTSHSKRISRHTLWRVIRRYGASAGIGEVLYPHLIRHTLASHLLEAGADLRHVQEILGHASVTTTQIYTHIDRKRLKSIHKRFHPRA
jgi:integrase/recombinase XerD